MHKAVQKTCRVSKPSMAGPLFFPQGCRFQTRIVAKLYKLYRSQVSSHAKTIRQNSSRFGRNFKAQMWATPNWNSMFFSEKSWLNIAALEAEKPSFFWGQFEKKTSLTDSKHQSVFFW